MNLKTKLFTLFLVLSLLPVVICLYVVFNSTAEEFVAKSKQTLSTDILERHQNIERFIHNTDRIMSILSVDKTTIEFTKKLKEVYSSLNDFNKFSYSIELQEVLSKDLDVSLLEACELYNFEDMYIVDTLGNLLYTAYKEDYYFNIYDEKTEEQSSCFCESFSKAVLAIKENPRNVVSEFFYKKDKKEFYNFYAKRIVNDEGELEGFLLAKYGNDMLSRVFGLVQDQPFTSFLFDVDNTRAISLSFDKEIKKSIIEHEEYSSDIRKQFSLFKKEKSFSINKHKSEKDDDFIVLEKESDNKIEALKNLGQNIFLYAVYYKDDIMQSFYDKNISIITAILLVAIAFILLASFFFSNAMVKPINSLTKKILSYTNSGDFNINLEAKGSDEIAKLNTSFNTMIKRHKEIAMIAQKISDGRFTDLEIVVLSDKDIMGNNLSGMAESLSNISGFLGNISSGNIEENYEPKSSDDEIGEVLKNTAIDLIEYQTATKDREWITKAQTNIEQIMKSNKETKTIAFNVLSFLIEYIDASIGLIYLNDGEKLKLNLLSSVAISKSEVDEEIEHGDGIFGLAAQKEKLQEINKLDYSLKILDKKVQLPSHVIFPALHNDSLVGIISISKTTKFTKLEKQLLETIAPVIAVNLSFNETHNKTIELLQETTAQQIKLETNNSELRQREEELQSQQEELRQTNEELGKQTRLLHLQKTEVENSNVFLEKAKTEIEDKAKELTQASQYKSEFLANMSHELRTPLNSILLLSETLSDNTTENLNPRQVSSAEIINSSGTELLALINDVLDLSKIEAGEFEVNNETVSFESIVNNLKNHFSSLALEKGIEFSVCIKDGVPKSILSDEQRIMQILKNFCSNAYKFTEAGSVKVEISKSLEDIIEMKVSDSGIGIANENLDKIFEAFKQEDAGINRKYGGTGLGLAICKKLAGLLSGSINLTSKLGTGSSFSLYLPLKPSENNLSISSNETTPKTAFSKKSTKMKYGIVAIADENNRNKITKALCSDSQEFFACDSYENLIDQLNTNKFKCVITDLSFTDSSQSLLTQINNKHHEIKTIVIQEEMPQDKTKISYIEENSSCIILGFTDSSLMRIQEKVEELLYIKCKKENRLKEMVLPKEQRDSFTGKTVLIVDDDPKNVFSLSNALEGTGINILTANNGAFALEEIDKNNDIDIVLMDIMMPIMNGYETCQNIRDKGLVNLPIIALTAKAMLGDREKCINAGASDYITKPIVREKLISLMKLWLYE